MDPEKDDVASPATNDTNTDPNANGSVSPIDQKADTSAADDEKKPSNLDDVLKSVLPTKKEAEAAAEKPDPSQASAEKKEEGSPEKKATGDEKSGDDTKEGDDKLPFNRHPRWIERGEKLRASLQENETLKAQVQANAPFVDYAKNFNSFMQTNGLSPDNVTELMAIGVLLNKDPAKARTVIAGILDELDTELGNNLPEDLAKRVKDGEISEEDAKALSTARAEAARAKRTADEATKKATNADAARSDDARVADVTKGVRAAETALKASDPDFDRKRNLIGLYVKQIMAERKEPAKNAQEGGDIYRKAHKLASDEFAKLSPKRTEERKPNNPNSSAPDKKPAATDKGQKASWDDAINGALS